MEIMKVSAHTTARRSWERNSTGGVAEIFQLFADGAAVQTLTRATGRILSKS
jgi:hypothetical protein